MHIAPLESILTDFESIKTDNNTAESKTGFTDLFNEAVRNIKETEAEVDDANKALLTGETDNIHTAMIAAEKAEIAVNLAVQIRNKVISAYNEVMGMQI